MRPKKLDNLIGTWSWKLGSNFIFLINYKIFITKIENNIIIKISIWIHSPILLYHALFSEAVEKLRAKIADRNFLVNLSYIREP